jgi:hypothetical protein
LSVEGASGYGKRTETLLTSRIPQLKLDLLPLDGDGPHLEVNAVDEETECQI